jgi:Co/Zn/Cd efflux system component
MTQALESPTYEQKILPQSPPTNPISGQKYWYKNSLLTADASKGEITTLVSVTVVCVIFIAGSVTGGVLSNSISIISDAVHMISD